MPQRARCPGFSRFRAVMAHALVLLAVISLHPAAHACSVCFGKSDAALAKGMNMGIFTLLMFIGSVLAALSCFFVFLAVRSSRHPQSDGVETAHNSPDNPAHS